MIKLIVTHTFIKVYYRCFCFLVVLPRLAFNNNLMIKVNLLSMIIQYAPISLRCDMFITFT